MREKTRSKDDDRAFLGRLRAAMDAKRMSQVDLALALGAHESTVSGWFTRHSRPKGTLLARLPGVLEVSPMWLLAGTGTMSPSRASDSASVARAEAAGGLQVVSRTIDFLEGLRDELRQRAGEA